MVTRLKKSYEKLKEESEALKRESSGKLTATTAAREGNMRLADALTKLKRAQKQIIQKERLHALEQVGKGITRDFYSVIMPILSTSDLLLSYPEHLDNKKELLESINSINGSAKNALKQLKRISDLFHSEDTHDSQSIDINKTVEDVTASIDDKDNNINFETKLERVPNIAGNESEIDEAIANLVHNAVEAMPHGGTIRINTYQEDGVVILTLSDEGNGMSDDIRQRALEPFFSTKGSNHSGMGLPIVLTAVGKHGGSIDITSNTESGTTITLRLPPYKHVPSRSLIKKDLKKLKILVIDDEKWVCSLLSKSLGDEGHSVRTALTGEEGITKCDETEFDIVILDRALPDITGDEVAMTIKSRRPDLPIILLSGFGETMKEHGEQPEGVDAVLGKPVTNAELMPVIASLLKS
jgi:CheY-like chemotaxis protein